MATRDIPTLTGWIDHIKSEVTIGKAAEATGDDVLSHHYYNQDDEVEVETKKGSRWAIFTCGAGLFSDGYVNNSIGTVSTCLKNEWGTVYSDLRAISNVSSIAFVGTVVGMLIFGYTADYHSRKMLMLVSTVVLILFTILCSGAWGKNRHDGEGLFTAITVYRFFLGIGIGGEYPAGSVACAEASKFMPKKHRNRWFCWFTNHMIDWGFVILSLVPYIVLCIARSPHYNVVWRVTVGIGAIPPILLFFMRLMYKEDETFEKTRFKKVLPPYWLIIKFYWFRIVVIGLIWFIYDFSVYAFGIYSSTIIQGVVPDGDIYKTFGWNIVLNLFYIPGAFLGAPASDYLGPRLTIFIGVVCQAVFGFAMAARYLELAKHVGGFVVVYGIFLTFGEFGPGDNVGVIASKSLATPIRGQFYGLVAAIAKIGAFAGTWAFPAIVKAHGGYDSVKGMQVPFYVASALAAFSGFLALFCLPNLDQNGVQREDAAFMRYLEESGFDTLLLGSDAADVLTEISADKPIDTVVPLEEKA